VFIFIGIGTGHDQIQNISRFLYVSNHILCTFHTFCSRISLRVLQNIWTPRASAGEAGIKMSGRRGRIFPQRTCLSL